ncbi:unnamed protein product, partial [Pylaiella littoralis]
MNPSSSLFDRIMTCARAISFLKGNHDEFASFYDELLEFVPSDMVTVHKNTNLIKASLEYLKLGFSDRATTVRKVNIALCVAINIGVDKDDENGLANEICKRFRCIENFDREHMMKIFNFSLCSDRVLALLDKTMVQKTKNAGAAIDHELRVEFIVLHFNILDNLVRRGQSLVDLGYAAHVTCSDMEAAKLIVDKHASSIATKCWACFDIDVLKKPRPRNTLIPAGGAFPRVSIVREHVDFNEATIDTLKHSLLDKREKEEFLGIMRAIISLAPHGPVATYRSIELEPVKVFFMETILEKAQAAETTNAVSELAEVDLLKQEIATLKEKVSDRE